LGWQDDLWSSTKKLLGYRTALVIVILIVVAAACLNYRAEIAELINRRSQLPAAFVGKTWSGRLQSPDMSGYLDMEINVLADGTVKTREITSGFRGKDRCVYRKPNLVCSSIQLGPLIDRNISLSLLDGGIRIQVRRKLTDPGGMKTLYLYDEMLPIQSEN
jgi:hypothetical protein